MLAWIEALLEYADGQGRTLVVKREGEVVATNRAWGALWGTPPLDASVCLLVHPMLLELVVTTDQHVTQTQSGLTMICPSQTGWVQADKIWFRDSCRPAADLLFASAVECAKGEVLALVLTGMGRDGLEGSRRVRAAGGRVLVQDEATSVVWGMPGYVAKEGLANEVLPLDRIGPRIAALTKAVAEA